MIRPSCGRALVLALPLAWLALFFAAPFLIVLKIALSEAALGVPPYAPVLRWSGQGMPGLVINLDNVLALVADDYYLAGYLRSVRLALLAAVSCLVVGFPMALAIARAPRRRRPLLLTLVILPFWTSFLLRLMAWIGLLADQGVINRALLALGLASEPVRLLYTEFAVLVGMVNCYLPFMVLPIHAVLAKQDPALLEAAADLGARPARAFLSVTLPLSLPGIVAGLMLVFIPAVGEFVIPELLGGPDAQLIGRVLWTEFFHNRDWPMAATLAVALLVLLIVPIALLQLQARR